MYELNVFLQATVNKQCLNIPLKTLIHALYTYHTDYMLPYACFIA